MNMPATRTAPEFGRRLAAYRAAAGRTLAEVSGAAGIARTYLCRVERGRCDAPSEATIRRLLAAVAAPAGEYDALLLLAGKVPGDVQKIILAHPEACGLLRERWGGERASDGG